MPTISGATLTSSGQLQIGSPNTVNISGSGFSNNATVTISGQGLTTSSVQGSLQGNGSLSATFTPQQSGPLPNGGIQLSITVANSSVYKGLTVTYPAGA